MDGIGIGFLTGLLVGAVIVIIVTVIVLASKKVVKKAKASASREEEARKETTVTHNRRRSDKLSASGASTPRKASNTIIIEEMDTRENLINKNIHEIRDLLLRLADVVSSTESASGQASKAFTSVKTIVDGIDLSSSNDLVEAQRVLVAGIDRVLKTNIELHSELDKANKGIAEQRRQIEELRIQARIDGLTRIPNRAALDERLKEYIGLYERKGLPFSVLLLDIDHFKLVNDQHGHINGDRILRGVASRISDSIRSNDFAARYGGEEFAIIFPGTDLQDVLPVADRIRADIARTNFRLDNQVVKMTVSGGLAEYENGLGAEGVIAAADKSLYQAKNSGRNQVLACPKGATPAPEASV